MRTRRVEVEDAAAVAALLDELGYPTTPERVAERLRQHAPDVADAAWVAVTAGGEVVGFAAGHLFQPYELDRPVAELTALVVGSAHRRAGAGAALVADVEQWASRAGSIRITVASALRRHEAHAFYGRLGYEQLAVKLERSLGEG